MCSNPCAPRRGRQDLWAPQMPKARGGLGLPMVGWCAFYEEANRSIFGPLAFNCAAPDDGNMNVLNKVLKTEAEKDRWLQPIIDGKVRSSFVMTEPHPGSGSDPGGMMLTRAEKRGEKYIVHGRKWFISGADGASHFILVARTSDDPRRGLSAFLFHRTSPAGASLRRVPTMGPEELGGACELDFDGLEIPEENRLMEEGDGLRLTQIRLGPARLTHCMRWLGLAKRCLEIAHDYVKERKAFGIDAGRARKRADHAGRDCRRDRQGPAPHHACGLEARPGRQGAEGSLHGEDPRGGDAEPRRRRGHPALRRARLFQGHGAGMDLPLCALRQAGGWRLGSPQDGAGPGLAKEGNDFWRWG